MSENIAPEPAAPPPAADPRRLQVWFLGIIALAVILFLLVQAKFLLISLAIAIMLFSLTSDAIGYFQRLRIGNAKLTVGVASFLAVMLIAAVLISISLIILSQANTVVVTVLQYTQAAQVAVAQLVGWMGEDVERLIVRWRWRHI